MGAGLSLASFLFREDEEFRFSSSSFSASVVRIMPNMSNTNKQTGSWYFPHAVRSATTPGNLKKRCCNDFVETDEGETNTSNDTTSASASNIGFGSVSPVLILFHHPRRVRCTYGGRPCNKFANSLGTIVLGAILRAKKSVPTTVQARA